jgi:hypothetical protein
MNIIHLQKKFRMARDRLAEYESQDFIIRIIGTREGDHVQYNLPTTDELAMLVVGDFSLDTFRRDIILETQQGSKTHFISASSLYASPISFIIPLW